jgi:alpha-L-glutamate ligase-like protein
MFEFFTKSKGILGMNARNLDYIRPFNRKSGKKISDNKILCKRILKKHHLPTARLIAKISTIDELEHFNWDTLPRSFALKPNRGFGGEGIVVVYGKRKNTPNIWIKANGSSITLNDIKAHIRNILDGSFSLSNTPDIAFFEERLTLLKLFKPYAFKGIPDIRIIVFNSIPVMAMLRLPTKESGGKANLQQGAIGLGIDLASGTTTSAVLGKGKIIEYVPGTRLPLSGIKIPYWKDILTMAVKAQQISGLGFLGADIAIDRTIGPAFLELNARPGLSIQVANLDGLKNRLERVKGLNVKSVSRGVRMGMDLFGGEIQEELEEISGKKIISTVQKVLLTGINGTILEVNAKIDTGADSTSIDLELARSLGFDKTIDEYLRVTNDWKKLSLLSKTERWKLFAHIPRIISTVPVTSSHGTTYRITIPLEMTLEGIHILTKATVIDRSQLKYPLIVGKKNLRKFLIDVTQ